MFAQRPPAAGVGASPAALAFFDDVQAAHQRAASNAGASEYTFRIGTSTIRLHFAGTALIPVITPALEHLRIASAAPADLSIYAWDIASTETPLPRRPWDWRDNPARGDVFSLSDARFVVAYNQFARLLSMLDRQTNVAFWSTADVAESGSYLSATPILDVLHWWLHQRGLQTVHSAAVGIATGGVLLAGKGGSGKSTTSLACLTSPLRFAGDDYCAMSTRDEHEVYSLYNSARIEAENLSRLPHLRPHVSNQAAVECNGDKATVFLQRHCPEKLIARFPLRAILLPHVTGATQSQLRPTSSMHALKELTITTLSQRAGAGRGAFAGIARVAKQLPCYALALGTDLPQLADLLEELIAIRS